MMTEIGVVSGEILTILEGAKRPLSIRELDEIIDQPKEMVTMSVGYLTRQGMITLHKEGERYVINNSK